MSKFAAAMAVLVLGSSLMAHAQQVRYPNYTGYGGPASANPRGNGRGPVVIAPGRGQPYGGGSTTVVVKPGRIPPGAHVGGLPPGHRYGRDGKIYVRPAMTAEEHDAFLADMFIRNAQDLSCESLGELVRRLSNEVLEASNLPERLSEEERRQPPGRKDEWLAKNRVRHLKNLMKRPVFFSSVMSRLTEAFSGCDRPCFDDGVAIGIISGTGYCNAAIGVGGLPDPGFLSQQRLPLCETANFAGCQSGYSQAVNTTAGCLAYATGGYYEGFNHQVSQDCHID